MAILKSARFAGDPAVVLTLSQVLNGTLRLAPPGTPSVPTSVLSDGPAVASVQRALADIGFSTPSGATGHFGTETASAVTGFKTFWHLAPNDGVVGRFTMSALDYEMLQRE